MSIIVFRVIGVLLFFFSFLFSANATEITLYENDFENPVSTGCVNYMYQGGLVADYSTVTNPYYMIRDADRLCISGSGYIDPSGLGGKYVGGFVNALGGSWIESWAMVFNHYNQPYLNLSIDYALTNIIIQPNYPASSNRRLAIGFYKIFSGESFTMHQTTLGQPTQVRVGGIVRNPFQINEHTVIKPVSSVDYTLERTKILESVNLTGLQTGDKILMVHNILDTSTYMAFDNLKITASTEEITPPIVTLSGSSSLNIAFGSTYTEPGATRTDNVDGSGSIFTGVYGQTGSFQVSGTVNTLLPGVYTIEYQKIDEAGNKSNIVTRTITVGAAGATLTPIIDGTIRTSGYTTPARIYHIRTGLDIQITANTNLVQPVVDFSLTGMSDDSATNSLTYRLRFTHPLAAISPVLAANIAALNAQAALLDDRSVRNFTGDVNPILAAYPMVPAGTVATINITAWSILPGFGTVSYALYDSSMNNLIALPGSINLEFTRPSLTLSGANPSLYEYNSGINPNLDVIITDTGLYADLNSIPVDLNKLAVSIDSGNLLSMTGLYNTLPTLGLGAYTITYYYTGSDADTIGTSNIISGTYVHALPVTRQLIIQDTTAPIVNILGPISGTTIIDTNTISLTLTGTDNYTLSGIQFECRINSGAWENCSSATNYTNIANGTHILSIRGKDISGNISSESSVSIIMNYIPTSVTPSGGYAGGGGGGGNSSASSTNSNTENSNTINTTTNTVGSNDTSINHLKDILNPIITNTCYTPKNLKTLYQGNNVSEIFKTAHQMLYSYGLTKWQGTLDYRPEDGITREEAARFLVEFAKNVLCRVKTKTYQGNFTDINLADSSLQQYIQESYEYEIFKGDPNGTFRPTDIISQEELSAVIVRLVTHEFNETQSIDWATWYNQTITSYMSTTQFSSLSRGNIAEVMYDIYKNNAYTRETGVGYIIK